MMVRRRGRGQGAHKYGAKRTVYSGRTYDSKAEAAVAAELDLLLRAGEIAGWIPQFPVDLVAHGPDGAARLTLRHKVDFRVRHHDGTFELIEVKGFVTADWTVRRRLLESVWLPYHTDYRYTVRGGR